MNDLEERLLECFPSGNYALLAFLRLADVVETDQIPTAAMECRVQPRLLINPQFVNTYADTPEKLLMLVMHELHHVLLGHTTLFPTATLAQNFVFDCVINALLSRMFPTSSYTSFFTDLYSDSKFPECFLRPPIDWDGKRVASVPKGITQREGTQKSTLAELYVGLYSETGVSYHEIYRLMSKCLDSCELGIPLLGGHAPLSGGHPTGLEEGQFDGIIDTTKPNLPHDSPVLFDIVREIVEKWPQPPDPIEGRSLSDILQEAEVRPTNNQQHFQKLRNLLTWLGETGTDGQTRALIDAESASFSAVPGFARRDLILQSLGQKRLLFTQSLAMRERMPVGEKVHVYVDVSGSMEGVLESVYGAVRACKQWVYQKVHLFSTEVVDVSYREFRAGKVISTYGTEISCVAQHIAENSIKRACLITDGYVGQPKGEDVHTLARTRLGVVFAGSSRKDDLSAVVDKSIDILAWGN